MKRDALFEYWKQSYSFKSAKEISYELLSDKTTKKGISRKSLVLLVTGEVIRHC